MTKTDFISIGEIEKTIYQIRGQRVMLDRDLAKLYGVLTGALNQGSAAQSRAVSRRFHVSADIG